jgi:hypothetical protein
MNPLLADCGAINSDKIMSIHGAGDATSWRRLSSGNE